MKKMRSISSFLRSQTTFGHARKQMNACIQLYVSRLAWLNDYTAGEYTLYTLSST